MDKLDLKLIRAKYHRQGPTSMSVEIGRLLDECERLQERESAIANLIAISDDGLQEFRGYSTDFEEVHILLQEVDRLAAEVLAVRDRGEKLRADDRARFERDLKDAAEHTNRAVDNLEICRNSHSDAIKQNNILHRDRRDAIRLRDEAVAGLKAESELARKLCLEKSELIDKLNAAKTPPAPVEGCKLTAEQVEGFNALCTEGERWMHGDCDLYLSKPHSSAMSRVAAFFSAGAVSRVSDVLNALPDLLHDVVTLRSECEHLRRRAIAAERRANEYRAELKDAGYSDVEIDG